MRPKPKDVLSDSVAKTVLLEHVQDEKVREETWTEAEIDWIKAAQRELKCQEK